MKLFELQQIFAVNVAKLILFINEQGHTCRFGEAWRTPEQAKWNAERGIGIVNSLHCDRLAVDLLLSKDGVWITTREPYIPFGQYWESLNSLNRWGGDWNNNEIEDKGDGDPNHFSMSPDGVRA
jgi:hypothetical protein